MLLWWHSSVEMNEKEHYYSSSINLANDSNALFVYIFKFITT